MGTTVYSSAFQDRALSEQTQRMKTDDRIKAFQAMAQAQPDRPHYRNLLAAAYIQKVRETTDFSYLERASSLIDSVLAMDGNDYEALRLKLEVELERHNFKNVAELATRMTKAAPSDPWNWGALGDAKLELGDYERWRRRLSADGDSASRSGQLQSRGLVSLPGGRPTGSHQDHESGHRKR